ncbi:MAG: hypothetical protein KDJ54_11510, partial [Candidatus Competibacteraceae bacterium]|nr:hypothetical protein [Candidatus Competibacteraceae bacterium]
MRSRSVVDFRPALIKEAPPADGARVYDTTGEDRRMAISLNKGGR